MDNVTENSKKLLDDILDNAIDVSEGKVSYANVLRFFLTNNEAIIDLYFTAPNPKFGANQRDAHRLQRIVVPLSVAKDFASLLLQGMNNWEETFGVTLPLSPAIPPNETE